MIINQYYINRDGKYHEFSLIHYLSVVSFLECNKNSKLILHTNDKIISTWIEILKLKYPHRFSIKYIDPVELRYDDFDCVAHMVDKIKLSKLASCSEREMVVDSDFICLKSIEGILSEGDVALSEERDPLSHHYEQLSIGWVIADPGSEFIKDWIENYKSYQKGLGWTYYSGVIPSRLFESGKYNVRVMPDILTDPYTYTRDQLRHLFLHNRPIPIGCYMIHTAESIAWDRYLKPLDIEYIMMVDTTFTKCVRGYVKDLWEFKPIIDEL